MGGREEERVRGKVEGVRGKVREEGGGERGGRG